MNRLSNIFVALILILSGLCSCGHEEIAFVVQTVGENPYANDTTGLVGGLAVNLDVTLLESSQRKSHVDDINRQLVDLFFGNAQMEPRAAMQRYCDSLRALPLPVDTLSVDSDSSTSPARRYSIDIKLWVETLEEDLVTFVCEHHENLCEGTTTRSYLAFDLKSGRRLQEQDLMRCDKESRAAVAQLLRESLESLVNADTTGLTIDQFQLDRLTTNDNFRIAPQSLVYRFEAGAIAPEEQGPYELEILSYKLHPYLIEKSLLHHYWFEK